MESELKKLLVRWGRWKPSQLFSGTKLKSFVVMLWIWRKEQAKTVREMNTGWHHILTFWWMLVVILQLTSHDKGGPIQTNQSLRSLFRNLAYLLIMGCLCRYQEGDQEPVPSHNSVFSFILHLMSAVVLLLQIFSREPEDWLVVQRLEAWSFSELSACTSFTT